MDLFISHEEMDYITKIVESLEKLINGASETIKHEVKKQEGRFFGAMVAPMVASLIQPVSSSLIQPVASSLIQPVASSLIKAIAGKGVMRAGKRQEGGFLPLLALPLMIKAIS